MLDSQNRALVYLYIDHQDVDSQKSESILRNILRQLISCKDSLHQSLKDLYEQDQHIQTDFMTSKLSEIIHQMVDSFQKMLCGHRWS